MMTHRALGLLLVLWTLMVGGVALYHRGATTIDPDGRGASAVDPDGGWTKDGGTVGTNSGCAIDPDGARCPNAGG